MLVAFVMTPLLVPTIPPPPMFALTTPVVLSPEFPSYVTLLIVPFTSFKPTIPPPPPNSSVYKSATKPAVDVTKAVLKTFSTLPLLVFAKVPI